MFKKLTFTIFFILVNLVFADKALVISDIHFNPFADCSRMPLHCSKLNSLIENPIEKWQFDETVPSNYKEETNNFLLTKSLIKFKEQIKPDQNLNIFITGDMLTHGFSLKYKYYKTFTSQKDIAEFKAKTLLYVLLKIHNIFPRSKIYFVLGNNDSDQGDYKLPTNNWLKKIAIGLSAYLPEPNQISFVDQFTKGGYYSIPLNNKIQIIGINDNVFTSHNNDTANKKAAQEELNWLNQQLFINKQAGKKMIILQHMPLGVDVYSSIKKNNTVMLLDSFLQNQYVTLLKKYSNNIANIYSGHLHAEYFQEVGGVPVLGTIALNRYFGNNAGLKLVEYNENTGQITKFTTFEVINKNKDLVWLQMYSYPNSYNTTDSLDKFIARFPNDINSKAARLYQTNYDGNSSQTIRMIHDDKYWNKYYCFMLFIDKSDYAKCLNNPGK
ncbi:MAG: metallophosphoesterase [Neisseriaceae bacterium]